MKLPFPLFVQSITEKKIYIFKENSPFGIVGHMHICLREPDGNILYFVCCTTKYKTIEKYLQRQILIGIKNSPTVANEIKKSIIKCLD